MKTIALRIDVDTYRGTKRGVPALCETLAQFGIAGTFFFSVGPDNMGRHLWRLLKPAFLWKMLRTNAAGLYGPEIVLMGTAWPGPRIGRRLAPVIRDCAAAGHEIGFHAWDHHKAQAKIDRMSAEAMRRGIRRGLETLTEIVGTAPAASATPGWRTTDRLLEVKTEFPFAYNSDCRGIAPFYP
ncbi:MAG: 4-deoxy-4-formamido-L-arabinose-phosphoundecaprenol deformylase, partial [Lentisphaeria bacterium]|nr:4-deoxy-4-formamido-L-arabinose-phosphoundecaprenol deformylase [Lentisphaeria bacterium]